MYIQIALTCPRTISRIQRSCPYIIHKIHSKSFINKVELNWRNGLYDLKKLFPHKYPQYNKINANKSVNPCFTLERLFVAIIVLRKIQHNFLGGHNDIYRATFHR